MLVCLYILLFLTTAIKYALVGSYFTHYNVMACSNSIFNQTLIILSNYVADCLRQYRLANDLELVT
jgi:hypothetical protein